jgi:hypothetical protein
LRGRLKLRCPGWLRLFSERCWSGLYECSQVDHLIQTLPGVLDVDDTQE